MDTDNSMDTDNIDVARSPPSCSSESPMPANDGSLSQPNTSQAPLSIRSSIMNLLNTILSPDQLQSNFSKLDFLKKSSFYIMIEVKNDLQPIRQDYIANSTIWRHIDRSRFERVKRDSINQVKLQLMLLTMLYDELTMGQKELKDILAQGMASLELGEANIQQKILRLQQTAEDFNETIVTGKLGVKHKMIPELISNRLPNFELSLNAQKPVMFKRPQSRAFSRSVALHWYIPDQEQVTPDDKFEIRYKILNPENEIDALAFGCRTCSGLAYRFSRLIPNRSYKFSVKRVDNDSLIYSVWKDTITLSTSTQSTRVDL